MESTDQDMIKEHHECLYGKPENIVQYMDYTNGQVDNGRYIPTLVPGVLQPLEEISDNETDELLSTIDIDALIK